MCHIMNQMVCDLADDLGGNDPIYIPQMIRALDKIAGNYDCCKRHRPKREYSLEYFMEGIHIPLPEEDHWQLRLLEGS